jgi:hypothetical protein
MVFYHRGEGRSKGRPSQGDWFPYRKLQNEAIQSRISRCLWLFMFRVRGKGIGTKVIWSDRKWRFKQEIMLWTRAVFCLWLMPKKGEILTSGAEQTTYQPWNASGNVQARLPWRVKATDFEPENELIVISVLSNLFVRQFEFFLSLNSHDLRCPWV